MKETRYLETITGNGKLLVDGQPDRNVFYSIDVYQDIHIVGRIQERVEGLKSFSVNLSGLSNNDPHFLMTEEATLEMEDGRAMRLMFDSRGIHTLSGPK